MPGSWYIVNCPKYRYQALFNFKRLCWRTAARNCLCGGVLAVVSGACMVYVVGAIRRCWCFRYRILLRPLTGARWWQGQRPEWEGTAGPGCATSTGARRWRGQVETLASNTTCQTVVVCITLSITVWTGYKVTGATWVGYMDLIWPTRLPIPRLRPGLPPGIILWRQTWHQSPPEKGPQKDPP